MHQFSDSEMAGRVNKSLQLLSITDRSRACEVFTHVGHGLSSIHLHGGEGGEVVGEEGGGLAGGVEDEDLVGEEEGVNHFQKGFGVRAVSVSCYDDLRVGRGGGEGER